MSLKIIATRSTTDLIHGEALSQTYELTNPTKDELSKLNEFLNMKVGEDNVVIQHNQTECKGVDEIPSKQLSFSSTLPVTCSYGVYIRTLIDLLDNKKFVEAVRKELSKTKAENTRITTRFAKHFIACAHCYGGDHDVFLTADLDNILLNIDAVQSQESTTYFCAQLKDAGYLIPSKPTLPSKFRAYKLNFDREEWGAVVDIINRPEFKELHEKVYNALYPNDAKAE